MPLAEELPGFYYDAEKNRYFPIKGPIPSSSRTSSAKPGTKKSPPSSTQERSSCRKLRKRTCNLIHARELNGNIINSYKWKCNFREEFQKIQASQPVQVITRVSLKDEKEIKAWEVVGLVWKYQGTDRIGISVLEQIHIDVQTLEGQTKANVLLLGNSNGLLSLSEVGKVGQHNDGGVKWMPDCVRHYVKGKTDEHDEAPGPVYRHDGASLLMSSSISCIRLGPKCSYHGVDNGPNFRHALFTTLGSETSGGSVYIIGLVEPLDLGSGISNMWSRLKKVASFKCTLWTSEYDHSRQRAVIGANMGAAMVDLETGMPSWFLHCKSDVFAQQIVNSGNVILCGLRNGAIVTIDFREKRERFSSRLITHRIPYTLSDKKVGSSNKEWFKLTGDIYPSHTIRMPSSISCLVSLQFDDQYFLASSMDGSVRLYDHRLLQRGAVQSYEGHVNSHTRIQLGVDPSERFVMSGGEDCNLRLWSIRSGQLLFEDKFSDKVLSTVCYQTSRKEKNQYVDDFSLGAWLGSQDGLFYMHWL